MGAGAEFYFRFRNRKINLLLTKMNTTQKVQSSVLIKIKLMFHLVVAYRNVT